MATFQRQWRIIPKSKQAKNQKRCGCILPLQNFDLRTGNGHHQRVINLVFILLVLKDVQEEKS
jgi:hypothetical protein